MFGIGYFKGKPTDYIIRYAAGRPVSEGQGLAFFYLRYNTQIVSVPTSSVDVNFVFNEATNNFQEVTIQGQLTYRLRDAKKAASLLNFMIDPRSGSYVSDDPEKLNRRVSNVVQIATRSEIQQRTLEQTLREAQSIASTVLTGLRERDQLADAGVELLSVYFLSCRPTPEVGKALEAEYRESLLRKADEAIYARRAAAVEEERKVKEKELSSEMALEEQRRQLIVLQGQNSREEAENRGKTLELDATYKARATETEAQARAKAAEMELAVYRTLEPRYLLAFAMKELGHNAGNIGNLTITTEMLSALLNGTSDRPSH